MLHIVLLPERLIPEPDPVLYPCANNAWVQQFIAGRYKEGHCWAYGSWWLGVSRKIMEGFFLLKIVPEQWQWFILLLVISFTALTEHLEYWVWRHKWSYSSTRALKSCARAGKNMEVHRHPHLIMHKKRRNEYLPNSRDMLCCVLRLLHRLWDNLSNKSEKIGKCVAFM